MAVSANSDDRQARDRGVWRIVAAGAPWLTALSPGTGVRGALLELDVFESNLKTWRAALDAWKTIVRLQQDMALGLLRQQLGAPAAMSAETGGWVREGLFWPLETAIGAYQDMSASLLNAERQAVNYASETDEAA